MKGRSLSRQTVGPYYAVHKLHSFLLIASPARTLMIFYENFAELLEVGKEPGNIIL